MNAMRVTAVLLVAGMVGGVWAEEKADTNKAKLVGVWEIVKADEGAPPVGTLVEFAKDGKLKLTVKAEGKESVMDGSYTVDADKISVTLKQGDKESKHTVTIKKLTATEFVGENEKGNKAEFKRKK